MEDMRPPMRIWILADEWVGIEVDINAKEFCLLRTKDEDEEGPNVRRQYLTSMKSGAIEYFIKTKGGYKPHE